MVAKLQLPTHPPGPVASDQSCRDPSINKSVIPELFHSNIQIQIGKVLKFNPTWLLAITSASLALGLGMVNVESRRIVLGTCEALDFSPSKSAGLWRERFCSIGPESCWSTSVMTSTVWALPSSAIASAAMAMVSILACSYSAFVITSCSSAHKENGITSWFAWFAHVFFCQFQSEESIDTCKLKRPLPGHRLPLTWQRERVGSS